MAMIEVTEEERKSWLATLLLKGTNVDKTKDENYYNSVWYQRRSKKLDIPLITVEKAIEMEGNKEIRTYFIRARYNFHGRARKYYTNWPMAIMEINWWLHDYQKKGLGTIDLQNRTFTLIDGYGKGKAIYTMPNDEDISYLVAYEGTMR